MINKIRSQATKEVELIQEGDISYLVLNKKDDFTFTPHNIRLIHECLDQLEHSAKPTVMITVSTSTRKCSTGFDLSYWNVQGRSFESLIAMQKLLGRMLTLPFPTLYIAEGHLYAGGLIFALTHDYRAMKANSGRLCLSEINVGITLPPFYNEVCQSMIPVQIYREMVMGRPVSTDEAFKRKILHHVFTDEKSLEPFTKRFVSHGLNIAKRRDVIKTIKQQFH